MGDGAHPFIGHIYGNAHMLHRTLFAVCLKHAGRRGRTECSSKRTGGIHTPTASAGGVLGSSRENYPQLAVMTICHMRPGQVWEKQNAYQQLHA